MKRIRSATLATLALSLVSALPLAGPASAQSVSHSAPIVSTKTWSVQGALTIGKVAVIFPVGSTFTASYNSSNGALTNGALSVPERTMKWPGVDADISVKLKDLGDATGWLAPNGDASISDSLTATINNSFLPVPCDVGPMDITVSTAAAGGSVFQGAPSTGTLVDSEFTAPRPTVADACTEDWADLYSRLPLPATGNVKVTLTEVVNPVASWSTKTWAVQGTLAIGQISLKFPAGSRFTASYDANSGTLANGSLSVPESTLYGMFTVKLKDLGDATGTLAPNGVATISESLTATLKLSGMTTPCDVGPMAITVGTLAAGGTAFHGTPASGTLVDPLFTAPVPTVDGQCTEEIADMYRTLPLPSNGSVTVTLTEILPPPAPIYEPLQRPIFPAGVDNANPYELFYAISCSSPGNCTAAGTFKTPNDEILPMTQTSTNGVWAPVVPADVSGIAGSGSNGTFSSISCTAPGYCTAAGQYNQRAITQTSTNGVWAPAVEAVFSSDVRRGWFGPNDRFNSISCYYRGYCTAVGEYTSGYYRSPMTATSSNGVWGPVTVVDLPSYLDHEADTSYSQVSCPGPGFCTATGYSFSGTEGYTNTFTSTSRMGVWGELVILTNVKIVALSCTAPGYCTGAGSYRDGSNDQGAMSLTMVDGNWNTRGTEPVYIDPVKESEYPNSELTAISCTQPGYCTAVGSYSDTNGYAQPLLTTSTQGLWSSVAVVNAQDSLSRAVTWPEFTAISCSSPGNCTAAGTAQADAQNLPVTLRQTDGVWAPFVVANFGSSSTQSLWAAFSSISCSGSNSCTAAGGYLTSEYNWSAMTMNIHPSYPSAPVNVTAQGAPGHAIVSWQPPTNTYGVPVTEYRVTVVRANSTTVVSRLRVSATTTQKIVALPVGSYSVSVAAVTSNGVGVSATTSRISVTSTKGVRVPPAPRIVPAKVADRQVTVSWLPPVLSDGGSPIYQYVVSDGQGHGCVVGTDARVTVNKFSCTVTGLINGRFYSFSVRAVNIMGFSVASAVLVAGPASVPTTAPTLSVSSVTASRITLDVTAPADMGGRSLLDYQVSFNNGRTWSSLATFTSGNQLYVGALKPNTTYHLLISARNAIGVGPAASVTLKTAKK
jgi:hypothetical protein